MIRQASYSRFPKKGHRQLWYPQKLPLQEEISQKPTSFKIVEDNDFEDESSDTPAQSGAASALDPQLYQMLKDLRKRMSKELEVPPYVIFQDGSLEAMSTVYPHTITELQNIPGVGAGKAKRYGEKFCALIRQHCEENNIPHPEEYRIRTIAKKYATQSGHHQNIDRKVPTR